MNKSNGLEGRCARVLRRHLEAGSEQTLHDAYEFGRSALAKSVGVLDMTLLLWRAAAEAMVAKEADRAIVRGVEEFLLECLSPFEMAHRGAHEANEALRRLDERREEHVRRIARELHDQAGQLLATVHLSLQGMRPHLAAQGEESLGRAVALLIQVEDELRRVAHELRPTVLDDLGLYPALRLLGEGVGRRCGLTIEVRGTTGGRLPPRIETELYRSVQEALSNVTRHASASHAAIEIRRTERGVQVKVSDDGQGFDPDAYLVPGGRRGLGLESIRERVAPLGGTLKIRSRPGNGTELTIRIPLEVIHADAHADCG